MVLKLIRVGKIQGEAFSLFKKTSFRLENPAFHAKLAILDGIPGIRPFAILGRTSRA